MIIKIQFFCFKLNYSDFLNKIIDYFRSEVFYLNVPT